MTKSAALRIRIEPELHQQFIEVCRSEDKPAAQVLREFMREYIREHHTAAQTDLFQNQRELT
jgi:predicted DNA-binding protein